MTRISEKVLWVIGVSIPFLIAVVIVIMVYLATAHARDDGRYADMAPDQKFWFENLASKKGLCCSFADGSAVTDVDWDTMDGHYRVRLHGEWVTVPNNAVVTESNKFGLPVVWPYMDAEGATQIRCFLPGAGG